MDWREKAICRSCDPELFFPTEHTKAAAVQIEQAKTICRRCPVAHECLAWALDNGVVGGVWGGLTEDDRRRLKRARLIRGRRAASAPKYSDPRSVRD